MKYKLLYLRLCCEARDKNYYELIGLELKSLYRFFLSFRQKVLSFMNSEFEKPKKISASKYAFLSKKVRNLSFDRTTGDWYLWRSSSKTSFAVISVLQGKTWQTKYLKLNFSVFRCVLNRKRKNYCVDSVNIQPEAAQVPSSTSSHQDFIMNECSVKNDSCPKTVLFARFKTQKT